MKGVSPVVATVLMVAVAIAAAVVAYSWFMSLQSQVQAQSSQGASALGKGQIQLEAVQCVEGNTDSTLSIIVRNLTSEPITGQFTVTVKDAVNGVTTGSTSTNFSIAANDVNTLSISGSAVGVSANCTINDPNNPNRIIVEVISPTGFTASTAARIS